MFEAANRRAFLAGAMFFVVLMCLTAMACANGLVFYRANGNTSDPEFLHYCSDISNYVFCSFVLSIILGSLWAVGGGLAFSRAGSTTAPEHAKAHIAASITVAILGLLASLAFLFWSIVATTFIIKNPKCSV